jgi:hypothetical protein
MSFKSILLWCPPGIRIGVRLGRVHWKTIGRWDEPYVHHSYVVCIELFVFQFSFWFCISVFMDSFYLVLQARLCHSHELHFCVERHRPNHTSPWICSALLSTTATSLLYLRYKIAKVYSFITSLIHLEPWTRPLPQQATPSCLAGGTAIPPSHDLWEVVDWLGFLDQVLGSMIRGTD